MSRKGNRTTIHRLYLSYYLSPELLYFLVLHYLSIYISVPLKLGIIKLRIFKSTELQLELLKTHIYLLSWIINSIQSSPPRHTFGFQTLDLMMNT